MSRPDHSLEHDDLPKDFSYPRVGLLFKSCWAAAVLGVLLLAVTLPIYALSNDRRDEVRRRQAELTQLQSECGDLDAQNQALRHRIRALQEDPRYLETAARAELGWVKERELLFHFGMLAPQVAPNPAVFSTPHASAAPSAPVLPAAASPGAAR